MEPIQRPDGDAPTRPRDPVLEHPRVAPGRRLIVVSHRLPYEVDLAANPPSVRRTVGGLVSGVTAFLRSPAGQGFDRPPLWVGWGGAGGTAEQHARLVEALAGEPGAVPVHVPPAIHGPFYDGFSNRTLWPVCHLFPWLVELDAKTFDAYRQANEAFAQAVLEVVEPGDVVWVHDYHLMLLPRMLRDRAPDLPIMYFHHIPWPPFDVLRVVPDPWTRALVSGLLGADALGLHTYDDVRHLLRGAERLLGVEVRGGTLLDQGRAVRVDAFPIGVDFAAWDALGDDPAVELERAALDTALGGRAMVLSVDRLDYTKGILNRLQAFETLLAERPAWRGRATLVLVVVPSRGAVEAYRRMRREVEETVGRINGRFADLAWTPILYRFRALDVTSLAAHYLRADVALVTPLRDGMNLVAKELLATRRDETVALVLSDTAGAARELGEAILVNPFHVAGLADALALALEMPVAERVRRSRHMRTRLRRYDVVRWGAEQLEQLGQARTDSRALVQRHLTAAARARLLEEFRLADERLLLLDYDGTLAPYTRDPAAAAPDPTLCDLLRRLTALPRTRVAIVSGRDASTLGAWMEGLPVQLVAEHGARVRAPDGSWTTHAGLAPEVRRRVEETMRVFADRLPGALLEAKELSLAWHWRAADSEVGAQRANELVDALEALGLGAATQVYRGRKVVEVRSAAAHKGSAALGYVRGGPNEFVLAAGDDQTDEDLFAVLPPSAHTLRVGLGETRARFNVAGPAELRGILEQLALLLEDAS